MENLVSGHPKKMFVCLCLCVCLFRLTKKGKTNSGVRSENQHGFASQLIKMLALANTP